MSHNQCKLQSKYSDISANVFTLITARKRSLGQGYVFTRVCHSVYRVGGGLCLGVYPPWTETPPVRDPLDKDPRDSDPLDGDPLDRDTSGQRPPTLYSKELAIRILLQCILVYLMYAQ